jgi:4-hydroxy-3-methylbut-2-enyl diphosphate reductase
MDIIRAKTAGFCMGVSLALRKLNHALSKEAFGRVVTFGPIIHNPQVLADYAQRGVVEVNSLDALHPSDRVLIRAHGIPRQMEEALVEIGVEIVDATCPKVKKAQKNIAEMCSAGLTLILFGEAEHPEVRGLLSYSTPGSLLFSSLQELEELPLAQNVNYFLAAQTTQDQDFFLQASERLKKRLHRPLPVLNTICDATRKRLNEAGSLAEKVDAMVVVGGLSSGNTRRLAAVAEEHGVKTYHVEVPEMLPLSELRNLSRIGLIAGASTPKGIIDATQKLLDTLNK